MRAVPVCKCFRGGFLFAEQPERTQREHVEEMTITKAMKVKGVPGKGSKSDRVDKEDTLKSNISTARAKCRCDLQSTRAGTYVDFEIDRRSAATRLRFPTLALSSFPDAALSRLRILPAPRHLRDHDPFY